MELATVIGFYLHGASLQSPNLDEFFLRSNAQAALEPLFGHFEYLRGQAPTAGIAVSLSAIYCYWRVEIELQQHQAQLSRWRGAQVRGYLLDIVDRWRQGGLQDESLQEEIGQLLGTMSREITRRLRECSPYISLMHEYPEYPEYLGRFAELVWAPRIWCFFVSLRLRHDGDFSEALWDKGFRFVAVDLDPLRDPPALATWRREVAAAGLVPALAGGSSGGGGGAVAANSFAADSDDAQARKLVAQLLAAEGR